MRRVATAAEHEGGEESALATLAGGWIEYLDRASSFFAEGYLAASHDQLRRLDARRSAIVDALLDAQDAAEVAAVGEPTTSVGKLDKRTLRTELDLLLE